MGEIITIGLDLAKSVFQVHGVDGAGEVVVRRQLRRGELLKFFGKIEPCLVGIEACGTSHYWARRISALGHDVQLMPPFRVKAYVKPGKKSDATDAAAICEAVTRPHMQFVAIKTAERQALQTMHRTRDFLVRQRTMLINAIRSHLAEYGVTAAQGKGAFNGLIVRLRSDEGCELPEVARMALRLMAEQIDSCNSKIDALEREIVARHRKDQVSRNLATIPGIGPIIASAITAAVADPAMFKSGRQFAAWLGLVPRQHSTGGKERLGGITKAGDRYLRRLLVVGATGLIRYKRETVPGGLPWLTKLLASKPVRLVSVALANKMARIAWAVMCSGEAYRETQGLQAA